jgi:hypothetical protein
LSNKLFRSSWLSAEHSTCWVGKSLRHIRWAHWPPALLALRSEAARQRLMRSSSAAAGSLRSSAFVPTRICTGRQGRDAELPDTICLICHIREGLRRGDRVAQKEDIRPGVR